MEDREKPAREGPQEGRLPYEPPRILDRELLEAVAGICAPPAKQVQGVNGCSLTQPPNS